MQSAHIHCADIVLALCTKDLPDAALEALVKVTIPPDKGS